MTSADLLSGPRGRRLCLEWAGFTLGDEVQQAIFFAAHDMDPGAGTSRAMFGWGDAPTPSMTAEDVAAAINKAEIGAVLEADLWTALVTAVDTARYWQEPDGEDELAATDVVREALRPVADAIAASALTAWWSTGWDVARQCAVTWKPPDSVSDDLPPAEELAKWRRETVAMEGVAAREWPADPRANMSAHWWSIPPHELTRTTRVLDERGPVGLALVEDRFDWERADCADVVVPDHLEVLEIWGTEEWAELCRRYPLPVTASKKHDWFRTTGRDGVEWVMPDWRAVAEAIDVVHLPVVGWLRTAGIAVPVADGVASVLAGWDPDAAFWLTSCPAHVGQPVEWVFADDLDDRSLWVRPER